MDLYFFSITFPLSVALCYVSPFQKIRLRAIEVEKCSQFTFQVVEIFTNTFPNSGGAYRKLFTARHAKGIG